MFGLLRRSPKLDWIQVEVTTRCDGRCTYCPRAAFANSWQSRDLPFALVESLEPAFRRTRLVHFQGWGEPLLHPDLAAMIRVAKRAGADAGTTTGGRHLDEERARELMDTGLDLLAFSLAGTRDEDQRRFRPGFPLDVILGRIESTRKLREGLGLERPRLHVALIVFRSALDHLEVLAGRLAAAGAEEIVVSSLTFVVDPALETEARLADDGEGFAAVQDRLERLRVTLEDRGVRLHTHVASPVETWRHCPENIVRSVVVGADGQVYPCVLTAVPVKDGLEHLVHGERHALASRPFGSLERESLARLWRRPAYRRFRGQFEGERPLDPRCEACLKRSVPPAPSVKGEDGGLPPVIPDFS